MAEIRIKNAPEDLRQLLKAEAKRLGINMRALMLVRLWGLNSGPYQGAEQGHQVVLEGADQGHQKAPRFIPPMLGEVLAYAEERKTVVDPRAFWHYYESNGWRVGKNAMKDWRAAFVTWERKEQQTGGQHEQQRRVSASEARVEQSKRNILDGITRAAGSTAPADGGQLEVDPVKRIGR